MSMKLVPCDQSDGYTFEVVARFLENSLTPDLQHFYNPRESSNYHPNMPVDNSDFSLSYVRNFSKN